MSYGIWRKRRKNWATIEIDSPHKESESVGQLRWESLTQECWRHEQAKTKMNTLKREARKYLKGFKEDDWDANVDQLNWEIYQRKTFPHRRIYQVNIGGGEHVHWISFCSRASLYDALKVSGASTSQICTALDEMFPDPVMATATTEDGASHNVVFTKGVAKRYFHSIDDQVSTYYNDDYFNERYFEDIPDCWEEFYGKEWDVHTSQIDPLLGRRFNGVPFIRLDRVFSINMDYDDVSGNVLLELSEYKPDPYGGWERHDSTSDPLPTMTEVMHNGKWAVVDEVSKDGTVFLLNEEGQTIETNKGSIDIINPN